MAGEAAPNEWVEIEHPQIEGTTRVAPESVPHWTDDAHGWRVVGDKSKARSKTAGSES